MLPDKHLIPVAIAQQILATFGVTKATPQYERWVTDDGFRVADFGDVWFESPFVFIIDWRAWMQEELESIAGSLEKLDVELQLDLNDEGETGEVVCCGRRAPVSYRPVDEGSFDEVIQSVQAVMPANIEFRASPSNGGSDTGVYAVLPRDEWADLDKLSREVVSHFFQSLPVK